MNWKKWLGVLMGMGCLLFTGGSTPLWASDADLIELLRKKNVISQEETDRMLNKVRTATEKEKADLKNEVKEDIKKEAVKGEFLPSALKGFKFGTTIFAGWENINTHESRANGTPHTGSNTNRFYLDRAYIALSKEVKPWLGMNITADLFRDTHDVANNGLELRVKYAYADLKYFGTSTKAGMVPTPSDAYDGSIWPYRVQGKHYLDAYGIQSSADLGIVNQGVFGGYMDDEYLKYGNKEFGGKWGGWMIGLYNGTGYDREETNTNKVLSGLIYVRPLPGVVFLKGLQLAYIGTYGLSNSNFTAANLPAGSKLTDYPDWRSHIAQASIIHPYFALMGQYYWGTGAKTSNDEKDRQGYLIAGYVRIPCVEKLRLFAKYYTLDPDKDLSATAAKNKNEYAVYTAGISYDVSKEFMPFIAWEREDNKRFSARSDYDKVQVGFQLKF